MINLKKDFKKVDSEKIKKIVGFFNNYAMDFLEDGTKNKLIQEIEKGDPETVLEIMKPMTPEWKKRVEELGYFRVFTEYRNKMRLDQKNGFDVSYMDSPKLNNIPTLKKVIVRERDNYEIPRL